MKQNTLRRKIAYVERNLSRMERGVCPEAEIYTTCDTIEWLWKFRYISAEKKDELCDRATRAMGGDSIG